MAEKYWESNEDEDDGEADDADDFMWATLAN